MATLSQRSIINLKGVHPNLVKVITEAIKDTPVDFTITAGVRTTEQQKAEFAKGRTVVNPDGKSAKQPMGNKVTKADGVKNKSNHQAKSDGFGHAVDLYPFYNGSVQVHDAKVLSKLKEIAEHIKCVGIKLGIKVQWGGNWDFVDPPHFELK